MGAARQLIVLILVVTLLSVFVSCLPNPNVVSSGCDYASTRLGEYSARAWAEVRNDGPSGDVVLTTTVTQGGHTWTKATHSQHLNSMETTRLELTFDEVTMGGGSVECSSSAHAYALYRFIRLFREED